MQRKETSIRAAYEAFREHDNESDDPCVRYLNVLYLVAHRNDEFQFHITYLHLLLERVLGASLRDAIIRAFPRWLLGERRDGETTVQQAMVRHSRYRMTAGEYLKAIKLNEMCIIAYMGHFDGTYLRDFDVIERPNRPQKLLLDFSLLEEHFDVFYRHQFRRDRLPIIFGETAIELFLHGHIRRNFAFELVLPRMNRRNIYWFVFCVKSIRPFLKARPQSSVTNLALIQIVQYPSVRQLRNHLEETFDRANNPQLDLAQR